MLKITIDPGASGAVACMDNAGILSVEKCHETISERADFIREMVASYGSANIQCIIESVHAMPGNGATSMFSFGENFGAWRGILSALGVSYIEITPQKWQKIVGNLPKDKHDRKVALKEYAQQRYPNIKVTLVNADALAMLSIFDKLWN